MRNECLDQAIADLRAVGIEPEVEHGGKHIILRWKHNNSPRMWVVPKTPSDWRTPLNNRSDLRKILKADGLLGAEIVPIEVPRLFLKDANCFASSLDIARHFEKNHKDVLRSIDRIINDLDHDYAERNFAPSEYVDGSGRSLRCFDLSRDGFTLVAMGFSGQAALKWKVSYLEAFNKMEAEITRLSSVPAQIPTELTTKIARLESDVAGLLEMIEPPKPIKRRPVLNLRWVVTQGARISSRRSFH